MFYIFFPNNFFNLIKDWIHQGIRWEMEASISENRMAARQQKTDANYLPVSAVELNILWHLLCLSKAAADVREVPISRFWKETLYNLGLQIISYTFVKMTRWKIHSTSYRVATKLY